MSNLSFKRIKQKLFLPTIIGNLTKPVSPILSKFESAVMTEELLNGPIQPVFIIGAPRTGSTLLYQLITNSFQVSYIDYVVHSLYHNLKAGFSLSHFLYGNKPHNYFRSSTGKTLMGGWHGPSECAPFWYQHLPKDFHYITASNQLNKEADFYRKEIFSIIDKYQRPFVFKNLNAGQRINFIHQIAPNAKYIWVRRNKIDTAQSIYLARKSKGIRQGEWWSVKPRNFEHFLSLPEEEMVIRQIEELEKWIEQDLTKIEDKNKSIISYNRLCEEPLDVMSDILQLMGPENVERRSGSIMPNLQISHSRKVPEDVWNRFEAIVLRNRSNEG